MTQKQQPARERNDRKSQPGSSRPVSKGGAAGDVGAVRGPLGGRRRELLASGKGTGLFVELADSLPGLLFVLDEEGRYIFWNRGTELLLGYSPEELDGRPGIDLVAEEHKDDVMQAIRTVLETGTCRVEYNKLTREGRRIPTLAEAVRFEHGGRTFIAGIQVDITERRRMEGNLLASREDLRSLASMLASAEETERRRIATGLHDSAAQDLALVLLELKSLAGQTAGTGTAETVERVARMVQKTAEELRSLSLELSPPELYEVGLSAALESLAARFEAAYSLPCRFEAGPGDCELPEALRAVMYRSVRELLSNVARHARAGRVTVKMSRDAGRILISVEDDGRGFASTKAGRRPDISGGFGLFSVHEQLRHLGGELRVDSSPGLGTRSTIVIPAPLPDSGGSGL